MVSAPAAEEAMTRYFGAQAGGFDRDGRFRHATNEDFIAIYESYRPYSVYSAAEIADNGIEIAKTP